MNRTIYYPVGGGGADVNPYPVGSIYQSTVSTSPGSLFGGHWAPLHEDADFRDRFLIGTSSTYTLANPGGEATVTLTTATIPAHRHSVPNNWSSGNGSSSGYQQSTNGKNTTLQYTGYTGGGGAHNNMPPYTVIYMWERTA